MSSTSKKSKLNPLIGVGLIILVLLIATVVVKSIGGTLDNKVDNNDELETYLAEMVTKLNDQLPVMVNGVTRLEQVKSSGLQVQYYYTVLDAEVDSLSVDYWTDAVKNDVANQTCQDQKITEMFTLGVSNQYIYSDTKNKPLAQFNIDQEICESFSYVEPVKLNKDSILNKSI